LKRKARFLEREKKILKNETPLLSVSSKEVNEFTMESHPDVQSDVQEANVSEMECHPDIQSDMQETNKFVTELADKAIQALSLTTSIGIQVFHSFFNYIKSNDNLYTMTGIPNFKILKMLEFNTLDSA